MVKQTSRIVGTLTAERKGQAGDFDLVFRPNRIGVGLMARSDTVPATNPGGAIRRAGLDLAKAAGVKDPTISSIWVDPNDPTGRAAAPVFAPKRRG